MSILEIQKALKAAGFDPGPLDGIDGPKTHAALLAFQKAHGIAEGSDFAATEALLRGTGGTAAPADGWATYQSTYPQFAWAFQDPEVADVLRTAMAQKWGPAEVQGAVMRTNWWKSKTNAERDWLQTLATNPKEAERQLNNYDSITKYMKLAADYGQQVSFEAAARQVDRVVRGEIAPDALEQELRNQAKALFPYLATQIDQGATVNDAWEPIRNVAANVLGINPLEIKLSDSKWASLMQMPDGKGGFRMPSQAEVEQRLRTDAGYGYANTQNGRNDVVDLLDAINTGFGLQ